MDVIGDFVDSMVKGAIERALQPLVTDGTLTQAQAGTVTAATMIEITAAIEIYQKTKTPPPPATVTRKAMTTLARAAMEAHQKAQQPQ